MKKELLLASALVSTMGIASVAEAVTATMSGAHMTGLQSDDTDAAGDAIISQDTSSDFSVSLSETTDGGIGIASSFMLANENVDAGLETAGLTLTFTDGSNGTLNYGGNGSVGQGGRVQANINVSPGQVLYFYVGGSRHFTGYSFSGGGWNGGNSSPQNNQYFCLCYMGICIMFNKLQDVCPNLERDKILLFFVRES